MSRVRALARRWMPPAITEAIRGSGRQQVFASHGEALEACGSSYDDRELAEVVAAKTEAFRDSLEAAREVDLGSLRTLVGLVSAPAVGDCLKVLDFGGQAGYHYFIARRALPPNLRLDWRVVETPSMASAAAPLATPELHFFDSIEVACKSEAGGWDPSLVFASGVLQYVTDPLASLQALIGLGADTIFITRTGLSPDSQTRAIVQRSSYASNGPGPLPPGFVDRSVQYPVTFVSASAFEQALESEYDVALRIIEDPVGYIAGSSSIPMHGFIARRSAQVSTHPLVGLAG